MSGGPDPDGLGDGVTFGDGRIEIVSEVRHGSRLVVGLIAVAVVCALYLSLGILLGMGADVGLVPLLVQRAYLLIGLVGAPLASVVLALAAVASFPRRSLVVDDQGARWPGWLPATRFAGREVVLEGEVGATQTLSVGGVVVRHFRIVLRSGWSHDGVTRVGQTVAELLGVELTDRRPADAWERWLRDRAYRACVEIQRRADASRDRHPAAFAADPWPLPHEVDMDGLVVWPKGFKLRLSRGQLQYGSKRRDLAGFVQVHPVFNTTQRFDQQLLGWEIVAAGEQGTEVLLRGDEDQASPAQVRWLVEQIREQIGGGVERGTAADVPEAMRRLRETQ